MTGGRAEQGQGRSLLRRGAAARTACVEGRVQVHEATVDPQAVACAVTAVLPRRVSNAEADDEVQAELIRAWLSGRGLPDSRAAAHRELRKRVVQRIFSDLRGDRRGKLAAHRRDLRDMQSAVNVDVLEEAVTVSVIEQESAVWGSPAQMEARADAQTFAVRAAETGPRAPTLIAVLADTIDRAAASTELGVSQERVRQCAVAMMQRVNLWAELR